MKKKVIKLVPILAVLVLLAVLVVPAFAQSGTGGDPTPTPAPTQANPFTFGVRPEDPLKSYFKFNLNPGESVQDTVLLINNSDEGAPSMNLDIQKVLGQTGLTGSTSFDARTGDAAGWVDFPGEGEYMVEAQRGIQLSFTVSVPVGTPPGEYMVGFIAMKVSDKPGQPTSTVDPSQIVTGNQGGMHVRVVPKAAVGILITVPTPDRCEINIKTVDSVLESQYGRMKFTINMDHVGNLHYQGNGHLSMLPVQSDGTLGSPVFERDFTVGYFIPGDSIGYPIYSDTIPEAGKYKVYLSFEGDCKFNLPDGYVTDLKPDDVAKTRTRATAVAKPTDTGNGSQSQQISQSYLIGGGICGGIGILLLIVLLIVVLRRSKKDKQGQKDGKSEDDADEEDD